MTSGTNRAHTSHLPIDQFDTIVLTENSRFPHLGVLGNRKTPELNGCHQLDLLQTYNRLPRLRRFFQGIDPHESDCVLETDDSFNQQTLIIEACEGCDILN